MPLVRSRCPSCSEPLGDPPHTPVALACPSCRGAVTLLFGADGQPADFDASFDTARFMHWIASARGAMARGAIGVAVGACTRCGTALVVSSHDPVSLPCPHCRVPVTGAAATALVDQWTEPWTRVEGGGISLEYRIALVDGVSDPAGTIVGCPACGTPTPPNDPSMTCRRCGAVGWVAREGRRVQLGVRIDGMRAGRPFNAVVSLVQGEQMLRRDLAVGSSASSGSSLLGVTGIGCAIMVAGALVLTLIVTVLAHYK